MKRIKSDSFLTILHQTRTIIFFGLIRNDVDKKSRFSQSGLRLIRVENLVSDSFRLKRNESD